MIKGEDILIGTLAITAGLLAILLLGEKIENKELQEENKKLRKDKFKLLKESLKENEKLTPEVKRQIEDLIIQYENSYPQVSSELKDVLDQILAGKDIKAIRDLAKIIENFLKERYSKDPKFAKLNRVTLKPLIEYAKEIKFFNEKQYNTACILHQFRNEESHELAVKDTENMKMAALLGGIEIIILLRSV